MHYDDILYQENNSVIPTDTEPDEVFYEAVAFEVDHMGSSGQNSLGRVVYRNRGSLR